MNFVEHGVSGCDEPGDESPGPVPAAALATNAAIKKQEEDEILHEMGRFADEMMGGIEVLRRHGGEEPAERRHDEAGGVFPREVIRRGHGYESSPEQGGPPDAKPRKNWGRERIAKANLVKIGGWTGIAPRFGSGH